MLAAIATGKLGSKAQIAALMAVVEENNDHDETLRHGAIEGMIHSADAGAVFTFSIQDYLGFMLLGLYVPTYDTLRGLCHASELEEFKRRYRCFAMDLASISKAQAHVPEEMLLPIIAQLSGETCAQARQAARQGGAVDPQAPCPAAAELGKFALRVVDSSVFAALPKMNPERRDRRQKFRQQPQDPPRSNRRRGGFRGPHQAGHPSGDP